jgi:hypothetical protein
MNHDYTYLPNWRAAVGMYTQDLNGGRKKLTFALAFCNYRDQFSRRTAKQIIDGRIVHRLAGNNTRLTFETIYEGDKPRKDIFFPVVDAIRDQLIDGDGAFERSHLDIVGTLHAIASSIVSTKSMVTGVPS